MHASSAVRDNAYVFVGVSGAGKTTISRLAPSDVHLLTDEISYVRKQADAYRAYGTPFAGESARPGETLTAPLEAACLLAQGTERRLDSASPADTVRRV